MEQSGPVVERLQQFIHIIMHRSMQEFILYSKKSGLSISQLGALMQLKKHSAGVSDLGGDLGVTNAAASQMLDRLVHQELILRTEDPDDRRGKKIALTDKGRRVIEESTDAREGWLNDLALVLSSQEKEHVLAALDILIQKAGQLK
jgi:DNA-binding MarR family transcriptional regulator